jgi:hypothetical protein
MGRPIQERTVTIQLPLTRRNFTRHLLISPALVGAAGLTGPLFSIARAQTLTLIQINVTSRSPLEQNFFFFEQPAIYTGGFRVYSNSLFSGSLPPYNPNAQSQLTFLNSLQYYAGVQNTNTAAPPVGRSSGYNSASVATALQSPSAALNVSTNFSQMDGTELALSDPVPNAEVQGGNFRIVIPPFNPSKHLFNVGSATLNNSTGTIVLSNFVLANPNSNLDCQPVLKYYVQTGAYTPGTVMNYSESSQTAALCDATSGKYNFNVVYNANGTWSVS